ncbi:MAG: amino acid ABC transporter substrate-binding protein [Anaerolineae bacterium]|nr:amino acid ABC transporter substrate-binding protein [Anaerolineae bacterium]
MRAIRLLVILSLLIAVFALAGAASAQQPSTKMEEVRARGVLNCGVSGGLPGFSSINPDTGRMEGLDADFCRVVAVSVFGPQENIDDVINFVELTAAERFTALQAGDVDLLMRNTTATLTRDASLNSNFGPITFYDGMGLMVKTPLIDLGVAGLADLEGASFCVQSGTTTEKNLTDAYSALFGELPTLVLGDTSDATLRDFENDACDALTSDKSQLAGLRSAAADPSSMIILPDTIFKEPLGPMYLDDDPTWGDIIDWSVYATFQAEEFGITQANLAEFDGTEDVNIARFLGQDESNLGDLLGISNTFAADIIAAVGNYGEIYSRNIDPIGILREGSSNDLWTRGGLIYPPAWR